jgi:hypothetical protein
VRRHRFLALIVLLATLALAALACSALNVVSTSTPAWTPPPVSTAGEVTLPNDVSTPTLAPVPSEVTEAPAVVAVPRATEQTVTPSGPQSVVITDADLQSAVASGALASNGVDATNLQLHFTGGKVRITADRISYGIIQANNLVYVGHLVAQDGALRVEAESVSPGGMIGALMPTIVNQALRQYASSWYVEQVHTSEGQIELTVR